ncbi:2-nitropropane dioxygenase [Rhodobacterales bacterium HKCCE2091]|nr:2-nitropropane dioxygenase [Rhodobacterales bacterium HKCCE2091]
MSFDTDITGLLGIRLPIVQSAMSWASSNVALPAAVSAAGGLGTLALGPMRLPEIEAAIAGIRDATDRPFAVNLPLYRKGAEEVMDLLERLRPPILVASQGGTRAYLERFRDLGTICIHTVASVAHAEKAAEAGVDGLVVVGGEAGGHPPADLVSGHVMLRAVKRRLPDVPVISAGGWADGAGLAAALALGAGAAAFGTRFLVCPEAGIPQAYKDRVMEAGVGDTRVVGRGFGVIRALRNDFTARMEMLEREAASEADRAAVFRGVTLKDVVLHDAIDDGKLEAGQSAGLVDRALPAAEVVAEIADGARKTLARLAQFTG